VDSANVLMWQGSAAPALEIAAVDLAEGCLTARGTVVRATPEPCSVSYRLETTDAHVTVSLSITAWGADWSRSLELRRSASGRWRADPGGVLPELDDALDCDIAYCCLTNSMPVLRHRLHSRVGTADLVVAWVSLPDLRVRADRQRYRHLARAGGGAVVRFESGAFAADVEFDSTGFVLDYPGLARRVR
jgi:uncharacterized protein